MQALGTRTPVVSLHRLGPKNRRVLLSINNFKQISQLNWLRKIQNQRLHSLKFERVGEEEKSFAVSLQLPV